MFPFHADKRVGGGFGVGFDSACGGGQMLEFDQRGCRAVAVLGSALEEPLFIRQSHRADKAAFSAGSSRETSRGFTSPTNVKRDRKKQDEYRPPDADLAFAHVVAVVRARPRARG